MPFVKVYIHFVFCTKNRFPHLDSHDLRENVWDHIRENAKTKDIFIDTVNGYQEHCHCVISLGIDQTMSKTMQLIKGESSYWINKNKLCKQKFAWQDEYFAVSVSESDLETVRKYLWTQEEHHKRKSFNEEFDAYIKKHGFKKFKDGSIAKE